MNGFLAAVGALIPSIGVGLIFWFAMRAVVRADGRERAAIAAMERDQAPDPAVPETTIPGEDKDIPVD